MIISLSFSPNYANRMICLKLIFFRATRILKNLRPVKPLTEFQLITRIEKKSFNPRVSKPKIYPKVGDVCNFQHDYEMASCLQEVEVQISRLMKARVILNLTQSQFSEYLATNYGVSLQQVRNLFVFQEYFSIQLYLPVR